MIGKKAPYKLIQVSFSSLHTCILISSFQKNHNYSAIIHLWRLQRCIIGEIWKIHWKSMIKRYQYCFANISATKARIFMKFYVVVNCYLVSLSFIFHEDSCINARSRVVNVHAHVLSRNLISIIMGECMLHEIVYR